MECEENVMVLGGQAGVVSKGHVMEEFGLAKKFCVLPKDIPEKLKRFK